jgi:hypothetical protein
MFNPLINPITLKKPILGIAQARIITYCEEPSDEDEDYFKRKHNLRMSQIFLIKKSYHD